MIILPPQENFVDAITKLIRYSVLSSALERIKTDDGYDTRAQLNLLIVSSFGSGKSTLFEKLEKMGLAFSVHEYTPASVTGTIEASGQVRPSVLINAANKVFIIDEFQKFDKKSKDALLSFMENQRYRKTLGLSLKIPDVREGKGYRVVAKDNWIETYVKCSFITGSMYFKKRSIDDMALLSRGFPIVLTMTKHDAYNLFRGLNNFRVDIDLIKLHEQLEGMYIEIDQEAKEELIHRFDEETKNVEFDVGFITRMLWDLTRIAAVEAALDKRDYIDIHDIKKASKFAYLQAIGIARGSLTMSEMKVLSVLIEHEKPMTVNEIVSVVNLPLPTVKVAVKSLYHRKMVDKTIVSGKHYYEFRGLVNK